MSDQGEPEANSQADTNSSNGEALSDASNPPPNEENDEANMSFDSEIIEIPDPIRRSSVPENNRLNRLNSVAINGNQNI